MAYSAKIVLNIEDPNGNVDGTASANDASTVEIWRRTGSESGGGSFQLIHTFSSLASGRETLTYEDNTANGLELKTPYYYKTITKRGSDTAESTIVGPVMLNGLHELAYPGNALNDQSGVPNYITVRPMCHYNAEWEYNYGGQVDRVYQSGDYITNQVRGVSGFDFACQQELTAGLDGSTPQFSINNASGSSARNWNEGFSQYFSNLGITSASNHLVALTEGYTIFMVRPFTRLKTANYNAGWNPDTQAVTSANDAYGSLYSRDLSFFENWYSAPAMASWKLVDGANYGDQITSDFFKPIDISDGSYYEAPSTISHNSNTYYGAPNGYAWSEAPGYYGYWHDVNHYHGGRPGSFRLFNTFTYGYQHYYNPHSNGGSAGWSYQTTNNTTRYNYTALTVGYDSTSAPTNYDKLVVECVRYDGFGAGTFYLNGTPKISYDPTQRTTAQVIGESSISNSYWGTNGYATQFDTEANASDPANDDTSGIVFNVPPMIATSYASNAYTTSRLFSASNAFKGGFNEIIMIPSKLTNADFQRVLAYLQNKYGNKLFTQGDYT